MSRKSGERTTEGERTIAMRQKIDWYSVERIPPLNTLIPQKFSLLKKRLVKHTVRCGLPSDVK